MRINFLTIVVLFLVCLDAADSIAMMQATVENEDWNPSQVQVLVLGTPHLTQSEQGTEKQLEGIVKFQLLLQEFKPDLVTVEWLHPSIDPEKTDNYSKLGEPRTLAKLWGMSRKNLPADLAESVSRVPECDATELPALRVRLGKQYYLSGDSLNAGYQWWAGGSAWC